MTQQDRKPWEEYAEARKHTEDRKPWEDFTPAPTAKTRGADILAMAGSVLGDAAPANPYRNAAPLLDSANPMTYALDTYDPKTGKRGKAFLAGDIPRARASKDEQLKRKSDAEKRQKERLKQAEENPATLMDIARDYSATGMDVTGAAIEGLNRYGGEAYNKLAGNPLYALTGDKSYQMDTTAFENPFAGMADSQRKLMNAGYSEAQKGNVLGEGRFWLGEDPTVTGVLGNTAKVAASVAPVIASAILTRGAAVPATFGGLMSSGSNYNDKADEIEQMYRNGTLAQESELFRSLIQNGVDHDTALRITKDRTASAAGNFGGLVAGVGGAVTSKLLDPATRLFGKLGPRAAAALTATVAATEDPAEEVAEGVASQIGANLAGGMNSNIFEGWKGNFVGGLIGGGPQAAISGVHAYRNAKNGSMTEREMRIALLSEAIMNSQNDTPLTTPTAPNAAPRQAEQQASAPVEPQALPELGASVQPQSSAVPAPVMPNTSQAPQSELGEFDPRAPALPELGGGETREGLIEAWRNAKTEGEKANAAARIAAFDAQQNVQTDALQAALTPEVLGAAAQALGLGDVQAAPEGTGTPEPTAESDVDRIARLTGLPRAQPEAAISPASSTADLAKPNPKDAPEGVKLRQRWAHDFDAVEQEYNALSGEFDSRGGTVLNTDLARELSPEYRGDRSKSANVHEASSDFIKALYAKKLSQPTPEGKDARVLLTAGGTGAGKTTGERALTEAGKVGNPEIIYDTNMNELDSSVKKIEQALKAGREVGIVYTYRDPVDALVNGALPRAMRMAEEQGTGRTVPLSEHLKTHVGAYQTIKALIEKYGNDGRVGLNVIDNSRGKGNAVEIDFDALPVLEDNSNHETQSLDQSGRRGDAGSQPSLEQRLQAALDAEHAAGRISDAVYQGFAGRAPARQEVAATPPEPPRTKKQNRDRSRPDSVAQMQDIRRNPDASRLGFSRDANTGAPLIEQYEDVPQADLGREDVVVQPNGRRVKVRYAVVEADQAQASHFADGRVNPDYDGAGLLALNNGRTAGLQAAWESGNADGYRAGLMEDEALHGVPRAAIEGKRKPMLVRLVSPNETMSGAESNARQQLGLSPVEQAQTDADYLPDLTGLKWNEDGSIPLNGNGDFFRKWFNRMGDTEASSMRDAKGMPNAQAIARLRNAMIARAYGDERLLTAAAEDVNPDNKNILNALAKASVAFAALDQNDALANDVREALVGGLELIREAANHNDTLDGLLAQGDMLGRNSDAVDVARYMDANKRSANKMAEVFRTVADFIDRAQMQGATVDIFGNVQKPTVGDALNAAGIRTEAGNVARDADESNIVSEPEAGGRATTGDSFRLEQQPARAEQGTGRRQAEQVELLAPPTAQERNKAAQADKDAQRNGLGRDVVRPEQGDGELLAGKRPAQSRVDDNQIKSATANIGTFNESGNILLSKAKGESVAATTTPKKAKRTAEQSQTQGKQDADKNGIRKAVEAVLGKVGVPVDYLHGIEGLEGIATPATIAALKAAQERRGSGTAGLFLRAHETMDGKPRAVIFTDGVLDANDAAFVAAHEVAGHHGLRALLGDKLDAALKMAMQNPVVRKLAEAIAKERGVAMDTLATEEALAELQGALRTGDFKALTDRYGVAVPESVKPSLKNAIANFVRRLGIALNKAFGRANDAEGFTDAQLRDLLQNAWRAAKNKNASVMVRNADGVLEQVGFEPALESASAMKSVDANVKRGREAMNQAITEKADKNRAMFREGLGWVDFVWGDDKKGLQHILKRRSDDGVDAVRLLTRDMVNTIAKGVEIRRNEFDKSIRAVVQYGGFEAVLVRRDGANSWLLTGFGERPGGEVRGATQSPPTQTEATRSRLDSGAGKESVSHGNNDAPLESARRTPADAHAQRGQLLGSLAAQGYAQGSPTQQPNGTFVTAAKAAQAVRGNLFDRMQAGRDMMRRVSKEGKGVTGVDIDDAMNFYRLENAMAGAQRDANNKLLNAHVLPIQAGLRNAGLTLEQFEDYLYAKAVPERNAEIAKINKAMPDAGAGITTQLANDILAGTADGVYSGKRMTAQALRVFQQLETHVRAMRDQSLDNMVAAGQITQKLANDLRKKYPSYVPMRGKDAELDAGRGNGDGKGLSQTRANIKRALGRGADNVPMNIIGEIVGDAQRSIAAREKGKATDAFLRFALAHPMPDLFEVEPVDLEWKFSEATGEAYLGVRNSAEDAATTLIAMHNGKPVRVRIKDKELQKAVLRMGAQDFGFFVRNVGKLNRWRSAVLTRYNPAFVPVNLTRDMIFGMTALYAERGAAAAARTAVYYAPAMLASGMHQAGKRGDTSKPVDQMTTLDFATEFYENGGSTGLSINESPADLQKRLSAASASLMTLATSGRKLTAASEAVVRAGKPIVDAIEIANEAVEIALRVAAYIDARKQGESAGRAMEYSKNLTINFDRKGHWGPVMNSIFLFYNATVQGNAAVMRVMRSPKTWQVLGGLAMLQAYFVAGMMGDEDDDGLTLWDKIPDYTKRTSLILPDGKGGYFTIPMPYGFNLLTYSAGRMMQYHKLGARPSDESLVASLLSATSEAFSPMPFHDGNGAMFGDTLGLMFRLASNKNDFGSPIAKETPYATYDQPKALQGKVTTPQAYHWAARMLAQAGGADLDEKLPPVAALDFAPEQLEEITKFFGGGLMNMTNQGMSLVEQLSAGNIETMSQALSAAPITRRFYTEGNESRAVMSRYYFERGEADRNKAIVTERMQAGQSLDEALASRQPEYRGFEQVTYKKSGKRPDGTTYEEGQQRFTSSGAPMLAAYEGSASAIMKAAEKNVNGINKTISKVRGNISNDELGVVYDAQTNAASRVLGEDVVSKILGDSPSAIRVSGDGRASAASKARALKSLQDLRAAMQKRALQQLQETRRNGGPSVLGETVEIDDR